MKILHKTMISFVLVSLISISSLVIMAYYSMTYLEEEASERATITIEANEEKKILDLAVSKAETTNDDLSNMIGMTRTIGDIYRDISRSVENINGVFRRDDGIFYIEGDMNITTTSMISGIVTGEINILSGTEEPVATSGDGTDMTGNVTFINGTLTATVDSLIVVPEDVLVVGYLDGKRIEWMKGSHTISGSLEIEISGDDRFRDPGILVRGAVTGYVDGIITGPVEGRIEGRSFLQVKGEVFGTLNGTITDTPQKMDGILKSLDRNNANIDSAYVGSPFIWKGQNEEQSIFYGPSMGYSGYNFTKRGWYTDAVLEGDTIITSPYIDATGLGLMVTISTPVYETDSNELIAVASVDVTIQSLVDSLLEIESYDTARSFLLNETGWLIAENQLIMSGHWTEEISTENYWESDNEDLMEILNILESGETGVSEFHVRSGEGELYDENRSSGFRFGPTTYEGDFLISYSKINLTGWSILVMVDSNEMLEPVTEIDRTLEDESSNVTGKFMALSFAILMISMVMASLIGYGTILPLERLTQTIKNSGSDSIPREVPGTDRNDEIGDLATSFRDMSEKMNNYQRELEEEISARKEKEKESSEERKRAELYLDLLSHDIGNLHQGIFNSLQLAEMSKNRPEKLDISLKLAGQSIRRSLNLVKNILLLSRVNSKDPDTREMEVLPLLRSASSDGASMFPTKIVEIDIEEDEHGMKIMAEPVIEQMFLNLIHNGIKFQDGPKAFISIHVLRSKGRIVIDFKDRGPGIPRETRKLVFGRFTNGEDQMKKGTGLGLHLVRELADRYHATVSILDRKEMEGIEGSIFRVSMKHP